MRKMMYGEERDDNATKGRRTHLEVVSWGNTHKQRQHDQDNFKFLFLEMNERNDSHILSKGPWKMCKWISQDTT